MNIRDRRPGIVPLSPAASPPRDRTIRTAGSARDALAAQLRRWLALHGRIDVLLPGIPRPGHRRQVRAILTTSDQTTATIDRVRCSP